MLDTRRWTPLGDFFAMGRGTFGIVPAWLQFGGPLTINAEIALNRVASTREPIYDALTDTPTEKGGKVTAYYFLPAGDQYEYAVTLVTCGTT